MATECLADPKPAPCRLVSASHDFRRIALPALLLLTLFLRAPGLTRPLLGNFATRNVVQAMEARNWVRGESPWWRPTLDTLADGEPAWHLVEVPCSAYLSGMLWHAFGGSLDTWGRATSIVWSLLSVALLFRIVQRRSGGEAAAGAAFAMAIAPIGVIYGQSFLLEPSVVALSLVAWWGTEDFLQHRRASWLALVAVALALLWLSKIYMLLLAAPLLWLSVQPSTRTSEPEASAPGVHCAARTQTVALLIAILLAALPVTWWSWKVWEIASPGAPTAARVYYSFLGSANDHSFPQPLLFAPEFYLGLLRDLCTVVLTPIGAILMFLGARRIAWRTWWPLALACAMLVLAMPRKFHEMNYYHLLLLPVFCAMIGVGWREFSLRHSHRRWLAAAVVAFAVVCSLRYSLRPAFVTPAEDRSVIAAAQAIQSLAAQEDRIIAAHGSSLDLLYHCDRKGWAMATNADNGEQRLKELHSAGAKWLVIAECDPTCLPVKLTAALERLPLVAHGDGFRIYQLTESSPEARSAASTAIPAAPGTR
jgi:hypothetical protein